MKIGKNAMTVLEKRYLIKDDHGNPVERVEDMFRRGGPTWASCASTIPIS